MSEALPPLRPDEMSIDDYIASQDKATREAIANETEWARVALMLPPLPEPAYEWVDDYYEGWCSIGNIPEMRYWKLDTYSAEQMTAYAQQAASAAVAAERAAYEEVMADHRRLVRKLDALLNGENAAEQASLCDLVSQVASIRAAAIRTAPKESA